MALWSEFEYDADDLLGWENPVPTYAGGITGSIIEKARDELRRRLRPTLRPLIQRAGVQEEAFYDALVTLAVTHEVYQAIKEFFLREVLWLYWSKAIGRPGLGDVPAKREKFFRALQEEQKGDFAEMIRFAMDEDDLSFSATRTETSSSPLWAIA